MISQLQNHFIPYNHILHNTYTMYVLNKIITRTSDHSHTV